MLNLKAVVEEIKGFSPEELERKLQDSKESTFVKTVDFLIEFNSSDVDNLTNCDALLGFKEEEN